MDTSAAWASQSDSMPDDPAEARRVLLDRQLERLDRLAEAGMQMVEALLAQARGEGPQVVEGDVALAYGRVSRAVRMAILLQSRLVEAPAPADAEPERIVFAWEEPRDVRAERAAARKERVEHIVEHAARREHEDAETVERLVAEAAERLECDDIYGDVLSRPIDELVAHICRDLGLDPDWDSLARRPWARRAVASGEIGWPIAGLVDEPGGVLPQGAAAAARRAGGGVPLQPIWKPPD